MNSHNTNKDGFTIIEVVLVLAIAGLIFLMVFIALPALQRSQRDGAKRSEVGTVLSSIHSYMSNNRNNIPPNGAAIASYMTGENDATLDSGMKIIIVTSSSGGSDSRTISAALDQAAPSGTDASDNLYMEQIKVYFGYQCDVSGGVSHTLKKGTSKQAAVLTALESGPATGSVYCQSS